MTNTQKLKAVTELPRLRLCEIYHGKDASWAGWHNLILDLGGPEHDKPLAGPLDPETSEQVRAAINAAAEIAGGSDETD